MKKIHIYVYANPNVILLIIKMLKCYTVKPNVVGRFNIIKYFINNNGNKVTIIIEEWGLDFNEDDDYVGIGFEEGITTTMDIGSDNRSYGIDFQVGAGSSSKGASAGVGSLNYNILSNMVGFSVEGGIKCEKYY